MSYSASSTETYSVADVNAVVRRVTADLIMVANSSGVWSEEDARNRAHDIDLLASKGFLEWVDLTLLDALGREVKAARFEVNTAAGGWTMSRPGGVLWPRTPGGHLRTILKYTNEYTNAQRQALRDRLRLSWGASSVDTSHSTLTQSAQRDYASNGYGMQRKDFT